MRRFLILLAVLASTPLQAESLKEHELGQLLDRVARESSVGTPRAINSDLLDRGYTVDGNTLVNHIAVQPRHAAKMRDNPDLVRTQLGNSVCANPGFRQIMERGAALRYEFSEYQTERPITTERFDAKNCGLK